MFPAALVIGWLMMGDGWRARAPTVRRGDKEQRVTDEDHHRRGGREAAGDMTSVFRVDFLNELATPVPLEVSGVAGLPAGSALLVVTRGPNVGSRFLLDRPPRQPDAIPTATSSSTTSPSVADMPNSAGTMTNSRSSTSAASTAPTSTANRWTPQYWPTATRCRSASSAWCS